MTLNLTLASLFSLTVLAGACADDDDVRSDGLDASTADAAQLDTGSRDPEVIDASQLRDADVAPSMSPDAALPRELFMGEPNCTKLETRLTGSIGAESVELAFENQGGGAIQQSLLTYSDGDPSKGAQIELSWATSLYSPPPPSRANLTAGRLHLPGVGLGTYCVVRGRVGMWKPRLGLELYKLEIDAVKRATSSGCEGPELPAMLRGCYQTAVDDVL